VKKLIKDLAREILVILGSFAGLLGFLALLHFPRDTDATQRPQPAGARDFYEEVYAGNGSLDTQAEDSGGNDHDYVVTGREAGETFGIPEVIGQFVAKYGLEKARVVEVGAGSGQLQDIVEDYTGLDIAASAARYFHKPFVQGSATDLPFADNEFDAAWTVWVLEHLDTPEKGFAELRRVVKPGGLIFLLPAWNCTSWASEGYEVRPYSDFDLPGKMIKASLPVRRNALFRMAYLAPIRAIRRSYWEYTGQPTALRYDRLTPNYDRYWTEDSDATASIDTHEAMLWHLSRGDECLNCPEGLGEQLLLGHQSLVIRVNKPRTDHTNGPGDAASPQEISHRQGG
jgi:SAM-dependent methyltransferase